MGKDTRGQGWVERPPRKEAGWGHNNFNFSGLTSSILSNMSRRFPLVQLGALRDSALVLSVIPLYFCHCNWSGEGAGRVENFHLNLSSILPYAHLNLTSNSPRFRLKLTSISPQFTSNDLKSPRFTSKSPQTNLKVTSHLPSSISSRGNCHPRFKLTSRC